MMTRAEFKRARNEVLWAIVGKKEAKRLTKAQRDEVLKVIDSGIKFDEVADQALKGVTEHGR